MTTVAEMALQGRRARKTYLARLIKNSPGSSAKEVKGMFTKQFSVSHRTFSEYLGDLEDEGVIFEKEDDSTGLMVWYHKDEGKKD